MPARDHLHEHVRRTLIRDGWTIKHDPNIHHEVFEDPVGELLLSKGRLRLLVFNAEAEVRGHRTMDTHTADRDVIEKVLTEYASIPWAHGDVRSQTVFDRASDHYLLAPAPCHPVGALK